MRLWPLPALAVLLYGYVTYAQPCVPERIPMTRDCYNVGIRENGAVPTASLELRVDGAVHTSWPNPAHPDPTLIAEARVCTPGAGEYVIDAVHYSHAGVARTDCGIVIVRRGDPDFNGSGRVDMADVGGLGQWWGKCFAPNGRVIPCGTTTPASITIGDTE